MKYSYNDVEQMTVGMINYRFGIVTIDGKSYNAGDVIYSLDSERFKAFVNEYIDKFCIINQDGTYSDKERL